MTLSPELGALVESFAAVPGMALVLYRRTGHIAYFGAGAERLFGYRAAQLVGAGSFEVLHAADDFAQYFTPEALASPRVHEATLEAFTRQRDLLPVRVTLQPVPRCSSDVVWIAIYRADQATSPERSQTEKEAEFLHEVLAHTARTIQMGVCVQEIQTGMIAYANEGFQSITGFSHLELIGNTWEALLAPHPATRERWTGFLAALADSARRGGQPPAPSHWEVDLPSGKKVVEVYGRSVAVEDHPSQYLLLVMEDHTDRHRLQMQLVQSEKLAAIGQLAAGIAHELRNPLGTIYNALYDLNEIVQPRTADVADDIEVCMDEIKRVQAIINNLLDFAHEGESSAGTADLNEVLTRTIRLVQHDLSGKSIDTALELATVPAVAINGNALKQILINLITNAAQAMEGGGRLTVHTALREGPVPTSGGGGIVQRPEGGGSIRLARNTEGADPDPRDRGHHVVLEVRDTGAGIDPQVLAHIFNPFFTTKPPGSGTGLGLAVVHALVRDAGGAIGVESTPGRGTTFVVEFPAAEPRE